MNKPLLLHGDCRDMLDWIPSGSIDSVVTDPPYGLSFMGKGWDYDVPSVEVWREVFRVLKPGGHLLSFFGTRTYHRGVIPIEDAGFEIRDQIGWAYGSGFPKSHDVSKAIDKARNEDIEPVRAICRFVRAAMDRQGLCSRQLVQYFSNCHSRLIDHWAARDSDSQPNLPTCEQWQTLKRVLSLGDSFDAEVTRLNARKGEPSDRYKDAPVIGEHAGELPGLAGERFNSRDNKIRALSPKAQQWNGWGSALKPAWEPIVLARKPLIGSIAENVLEHGTGALNIGSCRIEGTVQKGAGATGFGTDREDGYAKGTGRAYTNAGRWPANLIHDGSPEVLKAFPETQSGKPGIKRGGNNGPAYGAESRKPGTQMSGFGDSGSAARFFYCAKANKRDRDEGLDAFEEQSHVQFQTANGTSGKASSISEGRDTKYRNTHPTVKPTDLMRYLCRLITPPAGMVLDPFMGSGSTGKAATLEGFQFTGIEREAEYHRIATARIEWARQQALPTPDEYDFG